MLGFFFALSVAASQYSLLPPFDLTNTNYTEIGNWTLRRSAFTMRSFIRLTSQIPFTGGGLCHRVPTYAKNWIFEAEVSAVGGDGGRGFSFHHTTELCADGFVDFHGLGIWINTSNSTAAGQPVFVINRTDSRDPQANPVCAIDVRNGPTYIRITKRGSRLKIDWRSPETEYTKCTELVIANMITEGYFSVFAATDDRIDDHDVFGINVTLLSENKAPENDESAVKNRKFLEHAYFTRREKKERRRKDMPKMMEYSAIALKRNRKLDGNSTKKLRDACPIVSEAVNRARYAVDIRTIQEIVAPQLRMKLQSSVDLARNTLDAIPEMREMLSVLWGEVELSLTEIAVDIAQEMESIQNKSTIYARKLLQLDRNSSGFAMMLLKASSRIEESPVSLVLKMIMALEFVVAVGFFVLRIRRAEFKKWN
jgi:hypothetical protein